MAQVTITIPDDKIARVRDAFANEYGWTAELGITKAEFTRQQIIKFIKQTLKNNEGNIQAGQARQTVEADIEGMSIT